MVIMRRFKTNSASGTTSSNRKSSNSVSGLFKSASSPTPPSNFHQSTESASSTTSGEKGSRSTALFRYGRALNRSFQSGIGYVSGSHANSNNTNDGEHLEQRHCDDNTYLSVDFEGNAAAGVSAISAGSNSSGAKSPLSPKLPSRFKFSKNKAKSNSGSSGVTNKSNDPLIKQGASCPGLLETAAYTPATSPAAQPNSTNVPFAAVAVVKDENGTASTASNNNKQQFEPLRPNKLKQIGTAPKYNRPMLIRQHSDEHQNLLIEKAIQESCKTASSNSGKSGKDKSSKSGHKSSSATISGRTNPHKKAGKLQKMGALEWPVPTDIVFEEGDSNKCIDNVHFNDLFHGALNDASSITMPQSIRNDPRLFRDDVDIRFSRTLNSCKLPQIRYASTQRLFERLTDLRFLSIDFLNTFLLTYRVFSDSITVIEALKRVHYNPEQQLVATMNPSEGTGTLVDEAGGSYMPSNGRASGGASSHHLHPHHQPQPQHASNLLNVQPSTSGAAAIGGGAGGGVGGVAAANEYLSTTIEYDYSRRVSTSSVLSDINELNRESVVSNSDTPAAQQLSQAQQIFNASSSMIRNPQHWRLSYRKFEEEQARERYIKRMNNRNLHGSISSTSSSNTQEFAHINLPAGEAMLLPIADPIHIPMPPPPSPEVPSYMQKEMMKSRHQHEFVMSDSGDSSNEDASPTSSDQPTTEDTTIIAATTSRLKVGNGGSENLEVPVHSQSCDTLTEQSNPTSPLSSATSSATLVGSDSKSDSPRPSPIQKSPPQNLPSSNGQHTGATTATNANVILEEENEETNLDLKFQKFSQNSTTSIIPASSAVAHSQNQLSEGTPPATPPLPGTPKHSQKNATTAATAIEQTSSPISSVGSCFVMPPKNQQTPASAPKADSRSSSISAPVTGAAANIGRLSTTSTTAMNYLRVRGAGSKRGSGSSETESVLGSTSVTPRSSFQTDTTGISTPRSSFQHPDSPQMSSKAGVVVTSSRATSRRSSTASAASAFAVATAASSNPPEPMDPSIKPLMARGNSRLPSVAGVDVKNLNADSQLAGASNAKEAAANAARSKRESMISTAATMRVLNVLRHWVSKHSQDFENDAKLLQITNEFLDELSHNTTLLPAEHKATVQLQQMIAKQTMEAKEKIDLDVLLAIPMHASKDTIETLSALEIAEVMTYIDHNIFVRIQSSEFLSQNWMKEEKNTKAPHILLITKHFNDISRLVASEILLMGETTKRVAVIEKWAAVADICRCLHNFNGVLQICAAFTNSSIFRLKRTWEKVTKTTRLTIEKLQTLVSTDGRFRNMREALHRCDPPCIPYVGMYLTDLSFIEEGTPNFTDDKLLNFSKMRMVAHVIREIRHFQQTPYKIEHNARVINYLLDTSRHLPDEVQYQKSLCLEPRLSRLSSKITPLPVTSATSPSAAGSIFGSASGGANAPQSYGSHAHV